MSKFQPRPVNDSWQTLATELDIDPVLARILSARGVDSPADIDLELKNLLSPNGLSNIQNAAARVIHAIQYDETIIIAGDFDADGATASALCVSVLKAFGAKHVDFAVPDRFTLGYGLSRAFVETIIERKPNLIITADNGISSVDGVQFARDCGIDVIITDHHLPPDVLPPAHAIVNPQLDGCEFSSQPAGVGVAFYLMVEVRRQLVAVNYFDENHISKPSLAEWLDLVAVGTITDLVPLDRNNRLLVKQGLNRIARGLTRPGIIALCEVSKVREEDVSEETLGFHIGPRLNSAGRLSDISVGIRLLLAQDIVTARTLAQELNEMNQQRRAIQQDMTEVAMESLNNRFDLSQKGICIFDESYHEGIVGIVASRIVEQVHRPAVVFAPGQGSRAKLLKGSARSIPRIHIRDVFADINTAHPQLIHTFGGHAMAAGLTIHRDSFSRFANIFHQTIERTAPEDSFTPVFLSDGVLATSHLNLNFARQIDGLGPWGQSFPRPTFEGKFGVLDQRHTLNGKHLILTLSKENKLFEAIAFNHPEPVLESIKVLYRLGTNLYRRIPTLQLIVESIEPVEELANTTG